MPIVLLRIFALIAVVACLSNVSEAQFFLEGVSPAQNETNVSANTFIEFAFSDTVSRASIDSRSFSVNGRVLGPTDGTFSYSNADKTVRFTPSAPFMAGERVFVTLSGEVRSTDGAPLDGGFVLVFDIATTNGAFTPTLSSEFADDGVLDVAAADFNGDGRPDLVTLLNGRDSLVVRLLGNGQPIVRKFMVGSLPQALTCADFDGDGTMDVAIANSTPDWTVMFNTAGNGAMTGRVDYGLGNPGTDPTFITSGDLNNDGWQDIVVTAFTSNTVHIYLNNGNGIFQAPRIIRNDSTGRGPTGLALFDHGFDGDLDILVANSESNSVTLLQNNGDATFAAPLSYDNFNNPYAVVAADFNGDDNWDAAIANSSNPGGMSLIADGATFNQGPPIPGPDISFDAAVADFDADGNHDMLNVSASSNSFRIYPGLGNTNFLGPVTTEFGVSPVRADVADFDRDGSVDVVAIDQGDATTRIFSNLVNSDATVNVKILLGGFVDENTGTHQIEPISIEIRNGTDLETSALVERKAALLNSNGQASARFAMGSGGDFHIVVRHSGNLSVAAASMVNLLPGSVVNYDFSNAPNKAAGFQTTYQRPAGYIVRGGDSRADGDVNGLDYAVVNQNFGNSTLLPATGIPSISGGSATTFTIRMAYQNLWTGSAHEPAEVAVELRTPVGVGPDESEFYTSMPGLIDNSGEVTVSQTGLSTGSYWLCLRKGSYLSVASRTPVSVVSGGTVSYDFSDQANRAAGFQTTILQSGRWVIRGGDSNGDGDITGADFSVITPQFGQSSVVPAP